MHYYHRILFIWAIVLTVIICSGASGDTLSSESTQGILSITLENGYILVISCFDEYGRAYGSLFDNERNKMFDDCWVDYREEPDEYSKLLILFNGCDDHKLCGFFDLESGCCILPQYDNISMFTHNDQPLIAICINEKWGFCSRYSGDIIVPCIYDDCYDYENDYAIVISEKSSTETPLADDYQLINLHGEIIFFPKGIYPVSTPTNKGFLIVMSMLDGKQWFGVGCVSGEVVQYPVFSTIDQAEATLSYYN